MEEDPKYRHFYVNGELHFSLWARLDSNKTKEQVLEEFYEDKGWKFLSWYCGWKVKDAKISEDTLRVDITVREPKEKPHKG